jgi:hypothetical protein
LRRSGGANTAGGQTDAGGQSVQVGRIKRIAAEPMRLSSMSSRMHSSKSGPRWHPTNLTAAQVLRATIIFDASFVTGNISEGSGGSSLFFTFLEADPTKTMIP